MGAPPFAPPGGGVVSCSSNPGDGPVTSHFRYHIIQTEDSKSGALKTFRLAAATSPPWIFGQQQQDYTPEMLCYDTSLINNNQAPEMARVCNFDLAAYENQLLDSSTTNAFVNGVMKTFKYHTHFVEDPKVGVKKFFVASIVTIPRCFGSIDGQHYTPEMMQWDELCIANGTYSGPQDTMALKCQTSFDEIQAEVRGSMEVQADALFKHHAHEVQDQRVGLKKFFVAAITSPPSMFGTANQHYTPEMLHWDFLRRDNPGLMQDKNEGTMAAMCGVDFDFK